MRVLLLNAISRDRDASQIHPLGLAYLASYARAHGHEDVEFKITSDPSQIAAFKPNMLGVTAVSQNHNRAVEAIRMARESHRTMTIVYGGPHITALPQTLPEGAFAVMGEGELTFSLILRHPNKIEGIPGVAWRLRQDHLMTNPEFLPISPLDKIPPPARDLLNMTQGWANIFTSRGCPYKCTFCSSTRFWGKPRYHSAEYVYNECKELRDKWNVKHISISDDLFIANRHRLQALAPKLASLGITFDLQCRANLVTPSLAQTLRKMGTTIVSIGFESGCNKTLQSLKGHSVTVEDGENATRLLKASGINVNGSFIVGAPGETKKDAIETLRFIKRVGLNQFWLNPLTPLPGTPLWDEAKREGIVSESMNWAALDWQHAPPIVLHNAMKPSQINAIRRRAKMMQLSGLARGIAGGRR